MVARSAKPISLVHGGGQERSLRSGTMNYPLAASFAAAAKEAIAELDHESDTFRCAKRPAGSGCNGGSFLPQ